MNQPDEIYTPPTGPPQGPPPDPAIYKALGLEGMNRLLEDFYRQLGCSSISQLFPQGEEALKEAAHKSALFFVTVCGGPPLYAQTFGPPRMRARHLPFAIDAAARRVWLQCWEPVLEDAVRSHGFPAEHRAGFERFLESFSAWMVNRA